MLRGCKNVAEYIASLIAAYCSESARRVSSGSGGNASAAQETKTIEIVSMRDHVFVV
jgi:hypothetical protein